jgi:hypothetical protein
MILYGVRQRAALIHACAHRGTYATGALFSEEQGRRPNHASLLVACILSLKNAEVRSGQDTGRGPAPYCVKCPQHDNDSSLEQPS